MLETQELWVWSLGQEGPLEEKNGNPLQYSCLEKSHEQRRLVGYKGSQRVGHGWATECGMAQPQVSARSGHPAREWIPQSVLQLDTCGHNTTFLPFLYKQNWYGQLKVHRTLELRVPEIWNYLPLMLSVTSNWLEGHVVLRSFLESQGWERLNNCWAT